MSRVFVITLTFFIFTSVAFADVYKYIDENGVVCYTDAPMGKKAEKIISEKKYVAPGPVTNRQFGRQIQKAASKYRVEPELINAVITTESNGNHRAVSRKGAIGLMQLMPSTARDMKVSNPFNPGQNIEGGTKYLKYLLEKFNGNLTLALAAYNAGPKTVEKYGTVPPYSETQEYVDRVFSLYRGARHDPDSKNVDYTEQASTPIHRVILEDGTVLFTNSSFPKTAKVRF